MGKLGGLSLIAALALTGCAVPAAGSDAKPSTSPSSRFVVQPATVVNDAKLGEFVKDIQRSGSAYATMPPAEIAGMAKELCEHYDGGFTTDDLRKSAGDKLANAGETARLTVCPPH